MGTNCGFGVTSFGLIFLAAICGTGFGADKSISMLLEEAQYQEETVGDVNSAMSIYEKILEDEAARRPEIAKAMYRYGLCLAKKGEKEKAADLFKQVVEKYGDQKIFAMKAQRELDKLRMSGSGMAKVIILEDNFENGSGELPDGWEKGAPVDGVSYIWDKSAGSDGKASLSLKKDVNKFFPIAQFTRKIVYTGNASELEISANVQAKEAKKAIIDALFLDENNQWIKHEWVAYIGQKEDSDPPATHKWKKYTGKVAIPENTKTIVIGLQMYGPGQVWFDEVKATYIAASSQGVNIWAKISPEVSAYLSKEYGLISASAGVKNLYSNAHVYYVSNDLMLYKGGMSYYINWKNKEESEKIRIGGSSGKDMTYYLMDGTKMDTEFVKREGSKNYNIYWTPTKPLKPGEVLAYGWSGNSKYPLTEMLGNTYHQGVFSNHFGDSKVIETFFLIIPSNLKLTSATEEPNSKQIIGKNEVIYWSKEVPTDTTHLVQFVLESSNDSKAYSQNLNKKISVCIANSPENDRLSLQYAVKAVCEAAEIPYQWEKSQQLGGEKVRQYIDPINFVNTPAKEALESILKPVGLSYKTDENGLYLTMHADDGKLSAEDLTSAGWKLWQERKLVEAEAKFKEAIEADPQAEGAYQGLGWAQLNQGKNLNARDSFEKCVAINPKNPAALNGLGWIAKGQGNDANAIEWWEKAVEAQPEATAALSGLADTYLEKKEYEKAGQYYKQILKYEPENKQAQIRLEKANNKGQVKDDPERIESLIKELDDANAPPFGALNALINIGEPTVSPLIKAMETSNNWQIPKALGAIKDKRAVGPLIEKWGQADFTPMNAVIAEALENITGQEFGQDLSKWQNWAKSNQ